MRASLLIALALLVTAPARAAEEPSGCDKFKWNIDRERAALTAPDRMKLASGGELTAWPSTGITLALRAPSEARLPAPPERAPKDGTFAGFATFKSPPKAGRYTISLVSRRLDRRGAGRTISPLGHLQRCPGLRRNPKEREIRNSRKTLRHPDLRRRGRLHQPCDRAGLRMRGVSLVSGAMESARRLCLGRTML